MEQRTQAAAGDAQLRGIDRDSRHARTPTRLEHTRNVCHWHSSALLSRDAVNHAYGWTVRLGSRLPQDLPTRYHQVAPARLRLALATRIATRALVPLAVDIWRPAHPRDLFGRVRAIPPFPFDAHKSCMVQAFNAGRFRARSRPAGRRRQSMWEGRTTRPPGVLTDERG